MNALNDTTALHTRYLADTHQVENVSCELADYNMYAQDTALREAAVADLTPGGPDGIADLLVATGLSASKGAARRTIAEGGVSVNNVRVTSDEWVPQATDFLFGKWLVLRRGKRNVAGVQRIH